MTWAWCVRGDLGTYAVAFRPSGFVDVAWNDLGDLSCDATPRNYVVRQI